MPIQARRVFRLALVVTLSLGVSYGLGLYLPFLAPVLAFMFVVPPGKPMGFKQLLSLVVVVCLTFGSGILLIPMLLYYPVAALVIVALGLYFSSYLSVVKGKALLGTFLAVGLLMISSAGTINDAIATLVIVSFIMGTVVVVICHWIVYPFFPEDEDLLKQKRAPEIPENARWIALRSVIIVMPVFYFVLINPSLYLPMTIKSVLLSQQSRDVISARSSGLELVGSTLMGGILAVIIWILLSIKPDLWMFCLWILLMTTFLASRLYQLFKSRFTPSFWMNSATTMLIILGPAVEDSVNGKDVYTAFFTRTGVLLAASVYAWLAIYFLEHWKNRKLENRHAF
jgi:hypothetical protein